MFLFEMCGRSNLDLFHWIKARENLESYKLDSVAEHFLGQKKVDMPYKDLFVKAHGTPEEIAEVGYYCVIDCYLLVLLAIRLQIYASNIEMSRVTLTPMEHLITRGQQVKVVNQLIWYGHREGADANRQGGYVMNTPVQFSGGPDDSYEGATVIDAKAKYYKEPVAVLDFMSLYPSIILANNFCFSNLVQDERYMEIPGVEYVHIKVTEKKQYTWAKNMPGLIPVMMRALLDKRKAAKKLMAVAVKEIQTLKEELERIAEDDTATKQKLVEKLEKAQNAKAVYNARQLALKVSANSIYGFTGAVKTGKYPCLAIADCVTYRAREMLHNTVKYVQEYSPLCDVVYGDTDSIMVVFPNTQTVEEAAEVGQKAADWITAKFPPDIILEFEKVYQPWLLMKKNVRGTDVRIE